MLKVSQLSVKSKLTIVLISLSLSSILIISFLAWSKARGTLKDKTFNQLTSVRASKAYQIESYFKNLRNHIDTLCEDRMVVSAMIELNQGFKELNQKKQIQADLDATLQKHYTKNFLPKLSKAIEGVPNFQTYRPDGKAAKYLQYHYIAKNSNPVGEKEKLNDAKDGSEYSKSHATYHELFHNLVERFGYYDLFLIDFKTGDIAYTVYKETDFGTNLSNGPYRESSLAKVVDLVRKNPDRGSVQIVDFQSYRPSYGQPAAFIAGPIYDGSYLVGILAIQLPIDEINNVLTGNKNWQRDGLGKTGETYLVGEDLLMRSISRFLIEDAAGYKKALRASGTPENTIQLIEQLGTSIFLQKVDTKPAREALGGKEGTQIVDDYRGIPVLSSYSPLKIKGVNWAILSEMDVTEAYESMSNLEKYLLIATVILMLIITYLASIVAANLVKPIDLMIAGAREVGVGKFDTEFQQNSSDEFGELGGTFNEMLVILREKNQSIAQKDREIDILLLNVLPRAVVDRVKKGEAPIADKFPQLTVLFARVLGFAEISEHKDVEETAEILNELVNLFDEEAARHDVEKLKTIGDRYLAVCGLTTPRLDREKRVVDFALSMLDIVDRCNVKYKIKLSLCVGINTGAVMAGIVGTKKFTYDLWGETVNIARYLNNQNLPQTILVTQEVYDRIHELYPFENGKEIESETKGKLPIWILRKKILAIADSE